MQGIEGVWSCDKARDGGRNGVEKWWVYEQSEDRWESYSCVKKILRKHIMMAKFMNCNDTIVSIFYRHNVVGENTYFFYTKIGERTSLLPTS